MIDTLRLTAEDALGLLERGEVSSAELHAAYTAAAGERNDELHAYLRLVEFDGGTGVPIALKDVISTKGVETTAGSKILAGYVPVFDSTVAARCKAAGLPLLGKTNTDEFAMGSSTENSAYGPSHNPWDPSRVPGGSGGGTAAAVSGGLAPWGLGSDTGGSIKQPSALCGNVGLRPTYGTVSRYGIVAFASSLDQIGPVGKTVRDVALLYSIIAGPRPERLDHGRRCPRRSSCRPPRRSTASHRHSRSRSGTCRGSSRACGLPSRRRSRRPAGSAPRSASATCRSRSTTGCPATTSSRRRRRRPTSPATTASATGLASTPPTYREMVEQTRDAGFGDEPKRRIMLGTYALSAGYYDAYYGQAQRVRTLLIREHRDALERFDVIATPTSPTVAFPIGDKASDPLAMYACDVMTIPSCLAGLPGLSIPSGLSEGLPVGPAADRAAVRREHALPCRPRARARARLRRRPGAAAMSGAWRPWSRCHDLGDRCRARDPRAAEDADEDVLPLRDGLRGRREHADVPRLPRLPRRAARSINRRAVEWTVKLGLALGCEIAPHAVFARKNYFYPDLPKGYQISQYDMPSCENGKMLVPMPEGELEVGIVRAHLEEDAAKTVHMGGHSGRIGGADYSLVDYNRGGTPLLEIVTAPDIRSAEEAKRFLQLLRQTVVELGISDAEMEKGTLRVDANVSVRPAGSDELRTRCEIKNMNSFNYIARGIEAEAARQIAIWESGGEVRQETFDFDAGSGTLTPRRSKEEADDYRYFPEPDLVPVEPPAEMVERLRSELPEPPAARIARLGGRARPRARHSCSSRAASTASTRRPSRRAPSASLPRT